MLKQHELSAICEAAAIVIREHVAEAQKAIGERLDAIEQRFADLSPPKDGKAGLTAYELAAGNGYGGTESEWILSLQGKDGASVTLEDLAPVVRQAAIAAVADFPPPKDGKDGRNAFEVAVSLGFEGTVYDWMESLQGNAGTSVTLEDLGPVIENEVSDAVAAIPPPKDGKAGLTAYELAAGNGYGGTESEWILSLQGKDGASVTLEDLAPVVRQAAIAAVADFPPPKDGKDGTSVSIDDIRPVLDEAVSALPPPPAGPPGKDGTSVTLDDVRPFIEEAVASIPQPKDGKSVSAEEVVALLKAEIAEWELDFERRAQGVLERAVDRFPKPKDGRDALEVEDFELSLGEDYRTVTLSLRRGETVVSKAVKFPTVIYQGVWTDSGVYERNDSVTFGGNQWIALTDDPGGKPGISKDWQLSVKKGRDGRDRRNGATT